MKARSRLGRRVLTEKLIKLRIFTKRERNIRYTDEKLELMKHRISIHQIKELSALMLVQSMQI